MSGGAADALVADVVARMRTVLGEKLLGLYAAGSLAIGDFDPARSDVDVVGVLSADVDAAEYDALARAYEAVELRHQAWRGRLEVRSASVATLNDPAGGGEILSISPGEPFNRRVSDIRWQGDWYLVREKGIVLYGSPAAEVIAPISQEAFVASVRANVASWNEWIEEMRGRQGLAYALFALCRALRTVTHGDQLSKVGAARWAAGELPAWAGLIQRAITWRMGEDGEASAAEVDETRRFVLETRERILAG